MIVHKQSSLYLFIYLFLIIGGPRSIFWSSSLVQFSLLLLLLLLLFSNSSYINEKERRNPNLFILPLLRCLFFLFYFYASYVFNFLAFVLYFFLSDSLLHPWSIFHEECLLFSFLLFNLLYLYIFLLHFISNSKRVKKKLVTKKKNQL